MALSAGAGSLRFYRSGCQCLAGYSTGRGGYQRPGDCYICDRLLIDQRGERGAGLEGSGASRSLRCALGLREKSKRGEDCSEPGAGEASAWFWAILPLGPNKRTSYIERARKPPSFKRGM